MSHRPKETLEHFQSRVNLLDKPSLTSPLFSKVGWPLLGLGVILWLIDLLLSGSQFFISIVVLLCIGGGVALVAMSFATSHSEDVEETERGRLIKERTGIAKCLYLEGKVPDGKGDVGRCRLYEFDMVDHPYCLYCNEYTPSKGEPDV